MNQGAADPAFSSEHVQSGSPRKAAGLQGGHAVLGLAPNPRASCKVSFEDVASCRGSQARLGAAEPESFVCGSAAASPPARVSWGGGHARARAHAQCDGFPPVARETEGGDGPTRVAPARLGLAGRRTKGSEFGAVTWPRSTPDWLRRVPIVAFFSPRVSLRTGGAGKERGGLGGARASRRAGARAEAGRGSLSAGAWQGCDGARGAPGRSRARVSLAAGRP